MLCLIQIDMYYNIYEITRKGITLKESQSNQEYVNAHWTTLNISI